MTVPVSLMWFRNDLRVKDNPALNAACDEGKIIPIYIYDTEAPQGSKPGGAGSWWLHHSLTSLNERLNGHLQIFKGDAGSLIPELLGHFNVDRIFWNRCYEPWPIKRDKKLKKQLKEQNILVKSFNASLLWEPANIQTQSGGPYKVFTPYYKKGCLNQPEPRYPKAPPARITYADVPDKGDGLEALELMPAINWYTDIEKEWRPGEEGAADRLSEFLSEAAEHYDTERDIPSVEGTSKLSPHLHWGEMSPNQIWYAIKGKYGDQENKDIETFLSELGWREFSYYMLYHFPHIVDDNFKEKFNHFNWRYSKKELQAWQQGKTGIPIVDAGMRQLWQKGWMHNRVRMIVGSFLVKNLLMHWNQGEQWFWDCLVDADLASNTAGWQWVAGSGADASPYFRVFNPVLQGERFDKAGDYVRQFCPELKDMPDKHLHKPWDAPDDVLRQAGVTLGDNYPHPLVDLKQSRQRALDAFDEIKGK